MNKYKITLYAPDNILTGDVLDFLSNGGNIINKIFGHTVDFCLPIVTRSAKDPMDIDFFIKNEKTNDRIINSLYEELNGILPKNCTMSLTIEK